MGQFKNFWEALSTYPINANSDTAERKARINAGMEVEDYMIQVLATQHNFFLKKAPKSDDVRGIDAYWNGQTPVQLKHRTKDYRTSSLGSQEDANDIVLEVCLSFNPQLPLSTQVQTSPGKDMKSPAAYYFIMNMNRSRIDMVKRDDFVQLINAAISQLDRHPRLRGMLDKEFTFGDVIFRVITDNGARGGNKVVAFIPTEVISRAQFTIS